MKKKTVFAFRGRGVVAATVASLSTLTSLATLTNPLTTTEALAQEVKIPFQKRELPQGMTVIYHVDHSLPRVVVNTSFQVGARHEAPGRTGFAHLFEHLMFMGTERVPTKAFDAWMEEAGGWNNAWTSEDRTDYFDVAPASALNLLLWLEADRLRDVGTFMNEARLNAQREVVRNERRQTHENRPYGGVWLRLPELMYPEGHPYHHPVIGSHADLEAASVDDVKNFFSTWYDPANASLVVAGDFDPAAVDKIVDAHFATAPSKGRAKDPGAPGFDDRTTTLKSKVTETLEDNVELAKIVMAWQTPKQFSADDADLDLAGSVLGGGKASRLYQSLVVDQKLAQDVSARQQSGFLGSSFVIDVTARPGVNLDKLEAAMDKEVAKVASQPVATDELERVRNATVTAFVRRLESLQERASILNMYQASLGDPGYSDKDLARYKAVTTTRLKNAVATFLRPNARVVLRVVPRKENGK